MAEIVIDPEDLGNFITDFNEIQNEYVGMIDELEEYVEDFTKNSGIAYTHLVNCITELKSELDLNTESTESHLENLQLTDENNEFNKDAELGLIISKSRLHLNDISKYLNTMQHSDQKIFSEIKNHISKVDEVKMSIQSVEDLSTDIEILAFNAMIVAAKAGTEGLAFSCITDELKNISNQTLLIVSDLMDLEKNLFENYNQFQTAITEIENNHAHTLKYLTEDIEETFMNFTLGIDTVSDIATDIIHHFKTMEPEFKYVEDIVDLKKEIPESIQIVHEGLTMIEENKAELFKQAEYDTTCLLQLLIGQSSIANYCEVLFRDIKTHLDLSLNLIMERLSKVEDKSESIRMNQSVLKDYFTTEAFGGNHIQEIFKDTVDGISHISELIQQTMVGKAKISDDGASLIQRIEDLEDQFAVLTKTAKKFNLINISSKIEIAKRKVLSNHGNISDKIEEITEEIGKTLYSTYDQLVLIKKSTQHLLGQYNTNLDSQARKADVILTNMKGTLGDFNKSEVNISETFSSIDMVTSKFLGLLTASKSDVSEILKLTEYAEHIADLFAKIKALVENSKMELLNMAHSTEEQIPTPHYDRLFSKIDQIENIYHDFSDKHKE